MKTSNLRPKLGFRTATIDQKLATCGQFTRAMAKLPSDQRQWMNLAELEEFLATATAEDALMRKLKGELKAAHTRRKLAVKKVCDRTMDYALVYAACFAEDEKGIRAAGLVPQSSRQKRTGPPGAPTNLRATPMHGAAKLRWKNPMRRSYFVLEYKEGSLSNGEWLKREVHWATRSNIIIPDLVPGVLYYWRVQARNSNGHSPWSAAVSVRPL